MIEVKNLCKTYKPKKGPVVQALQDVSLKFGETGMVFILGKSGSGKSTLLNILGGLDSYDSGEFIIEGKSSNEFTQSDFDSYRNTLIGFIFQEYNILEEFSVGANIALAMQLQGKKSTAEALNKILEDVDLADYGGRKPNELSGGQKQRVAIARALIKDPRIIMADEPTGALDSNTGRQVFDTLKKLSKDKLVIIVSHDREFAEYYGDRVIELADGKIISDISKYEAKPDTVSEGISIVDGRIMQIKKGYKLNNKDIAMINDYLASAETDALLTVDERSNRSFKQIAMISDDGGKQSFAETDNDNVSDKIYDGSDLKLIKSRLPYKHSLKMGVSSLKSKPLKLIFTILLSFIAFALFGVADTLASYNEPTAAYSSVIDFKVNHATFTKSTITPDGFYAVDLKVTDKDIEEIKKNTGLDVRPIYKSNANFAFYQNILTPSKLKDLNYYQTNFMGAVVIDQKLIDETQFSLIGRLPSAVNEIVLPQHIYDSFAIAGYSSSDKTVTYRPDEIDTPQKFIDKNINLECGVGSNSIVVGILDTKFDSDGIFKAYINGDYNYSNQKYSIHEQLNAEILYNYHALMFIHSDSAKNMVAKSFLKVFSANENCVLSANDKRILIKQAETIKQAEQKKKNITYFGNKYDEQGIALSSSFIQYFVNQNTINENYNYLALTESDANLKEITYNNGVFKTNQKKIDGNAYVKYIFDYNLQYEGLCDAITDIDFMSNPTLKTGAVKLWNSYMSSEPVTSETITNEHAVYALTQSLKNKKIPQFAESLINKLTVDMYAHVMKQYGLSNKLIPGAQISYTDYDDSQHTQKNMPINLVGIFYSNNNSLQEVYVSDEIFENFSGNQDGYDNCIAPMPTDNAGIKKVIDFSYKLYDLNEPTSYALNYSYMLQNSTSSSLSSVRNFISVIASIFLYVGIGIAVFASLLLMNFISSSISYKKREIGILRAVGARGSDVFGIFCNESMIIALINFVLSAIASVVCCIVLNNTLVAELGINITILTFGIRQIALLFFVAVGAAFIASLLPVMKIAHKRPIDAIRNR